MILAGDDTYTKEQCVLAAAILDTSKSGTRYRDKPSPFANKCIWSIACNTPLADFRTTLAFAFPVPIARGLLAMASVLISSSSNNCKTPPHHSSASAAVGAFSGAADKRRSCNTETDEILNACEPPPHQKTKRKRGKGPFGSYLGPDKDKKTKTMWNILKFHNLKD